MSSRDSGAPKIYACLFYRDAPAAIDWLGRAFGFEPLMVIPGAEPGTVDHAELRLGDDAIMLGSAKPDQHWVSPADLPAVSHCLYIAIDGDVDAHCERARAAGATITMEPADKHYGSRDYLARDPEGNHWCFGTYRPALEPAAAATA